MCCFAQDVDSVKNTKIFTRLTDKGTQLLAYAMSYESDVPNAMILPVPTTGREDSLRFIDMSDYEDLFRDLQRGFPALRSVLSTALPASANTAVDSPLLKVHTVGSFVASFVPTVDDFDRLDPQFVIPKETWAQVSGYEGYGYAVFQLDENAGKTHPMAMEFETTLKEKVFFPTLHIHDGQVHEREAFDHYLFAQHAGFDSVVGAYDGPKREDASTGMVRSKSAAGEFVKAEKTSGLIDPNLLLHRKRLRGMLRNEDTLFKATGHPTKVTFNARPLFRWWPIGLAAMGLAWIVGRRAKLLSRK
ncbi:MAG: hypothetical protein Aurels2KO_23420 [Aureliella sp.]